MILAGDIGATHTRLGLFRAEGMRPVLERVRLYRSREHRGPEEIIAAFLQDHSVKPGAACLGVAGPVIDGRCETPNLAWTVDARHLVRRLSLDAVVLVNDLVANAHGIPLLGPEDVVDVQVGEAAQGNGALLSPGTGLGEAGLYWDGQRHHPFPSEGGHADFAPRDALEIELLSWMLERYEHVSYERLLSGAGLHHLYRFLRDTGRGRELDWLASELRRSDPAAVISRAAFGGRCALCSRAVERFVRILGAEAGNLALKVLAVGGVWLGGGIVARWLSGDRNGAPPALPFADAFVQAFTAKGRFRPLLQRMPVRAIRNEHTALLGAAWYALERGGAAAT